MTIDDTMPEGWPYGRAKTALIKSAAVVMQERGARAATLKNISQRAGVTEPAIFRHFDGVDGVFEGLFTTVEFFHDRIDELYALPDVKGFDRLDKAYMAFIDLMMEYHEFVYLILYAPSIFQGYPKLRDKLRERSLRTQIVVCVKEAIKLTQIRTDVDAEFIAAALVGTTVMQLTTWLENEKDYPLRERCGKILREMKKLLEKKK